MNCENCVYYQKAEKRIKELWAKFEETLVYAEEGEDFQQYVYNDTGKEVPVGTPIGTEHEGKLTLLKNVAYKN